jgi:hypothetical protein
MPLARSSSLAAAVVAALALTVPAVAAAKDVNHDGLPDRWELAHHLSLKVKQARLDQDKDGLVNRLEFADHTDPRRADSDGDGVKDGQEDADHDGVPNATDQHPGRDDSTSGGDAPTTPAGSREPATPPSPFDHIVSFTGGVLTIARADGSTVAASVLGATDVECGAALPGPFHGCGQDQLVAGQKVGAAMHGLHDGKDAWEHVFLVGLATTPAPAVPQPAPQAAPPVTGTVAGFQGGVLTVDRPSGEHPAGPLADGAVVRCLTVASGVVVATATCDPVAALVPGAQLGTSQRALIGGIFKWTKIDILVPAGSGVATN